MVMRNRSEGGGTPQWWDDLPPKVRNRFTQPLAPDERAAPPASGPAPPPGRGELFGDLSRLALLFALASLGILLYLLVVVRYVTG